MTESAVIPAVPDKPSWKLRRRAIFGWIIFCGVVIAYVVTLGNPDNALHSAALGWGFGSAAATVFGYAGFATLEDINFAKLVRGA